MQVRFLGPVGKVTGSCTWLRDVARGWNFLVDCGMQQGETGAARWNNCEMWEFEPSEIQFVLLTHAHVDHSGLLPLLYARGFSGPVYCTAETAGIAEVLLRDAAKQEGAMFKAADVDRIVWREPRGDRLFGKRFAAAQDLFFAFYRTGHVVGAVSVEVLWGPPKTPQQRSIVFSGDLGPNEEDREALPFVRHRMAVPTCNFAVVESTYGGRVRTPSHADGADRRQRLKRLLDRAVERKGVLMIPAFALGRTQDVLFDLHWIFAEEPERYGHLPVYLDSPAARRIHDVLCAGALDRTESNGSKGKVRPLWMGKQMFRWFGLDHTDPAHIERLSEIYRITLAQQVKESGGAVAGNALSAAWRPIVRPSTDRKTMASELAKAGGVILFGSGMCDGGPAQYWLPELLGSESSTVALSGYCGPATIGGQLLEAARLAESERRRLSDALRWGGGRSYPRKQIKAHVESLEGYSAHADQTGLVNWLFGRFHGDLRVAAPTVFIQHGNDEQRHSLEAAIKQRAEDESSPTAVLRPHADDSWFDLETDRAEVYSVARRKACIQLEIQKLQQLAASLEALPV